ncbi:extracellular solute-binding protein [Hephaestia sp. GCM10023244]|uniref:extracellular solute-binding protein n=1 Tax=unclassified Hephaestia TaxID=2631281 RepID=UPI002076D857|nr:extracellular solute-binding protein [Hephaestia sp. MAHUQ-44]MCM8729862.1 extracellular solute-binding protein [Hephaestia sp. MAHUQ-44]
MRRFALLALALLVAACGGAAHDDRTTLVIQRFFGACEADYGRNTDIAAAEGECGIMTSIINKFEADNPDIRVVENIVFWPGYDQLTAQLAANDAPDLVTMHGSVIADYQARGLLDPVGGDLASVGITPDRFTDAARRAVTIDGKVWGLPLDSWTMLWHVNTNLFRETGLMRNGQPILPRSPEELLAQAEQFKRRTGKPYLVQATANEYASYTRNFYTFALQQGVPLFTDARHANFRTPAAHRALELFKQIRSRDLTTQNQDYSAAVASFLGGGGGVFLVGTWMVQDFDAASRNPDSALHNGYAVFPYPQLFQRDVTFADGHNWVMPHNPARTPAEHDAALRFLKFFAAHDQDWARTGHMPAFEAVIENPAWRALPHRAALAEIARTATPLPKQIRRQFPIETVIGQEAAAAIAGNKSIDQALADMERRVNDILQHI